MPRKRERGVFVAGSAIFGSKDWAATIKELRTNGESRLAVGESR